ncbi:MULTISPECIES: hypothetical protein [unclassified Streptomyces]|uniref:hypothetical protein n=1 Tax=unclassified Streptomyces TaxID=2593676 RepID=UPI002E1D2646|nr:MULTISPECIES: hypothetical protein [unclassified Streptomyces]WSX47449.1 hypothetical protein OG760_37755 [Streptomyces sp. NBC_00963]
MLIPLPKAIDRYKQEPGAPGNAYDWYRRSAQRDNKVWIHDRTVPVVKVGRQWMVDDGHLDAALAAMAKARALRAQRSAEYCRHVLHPGTVDMDGGRYRVVGAFHFVWSDMAIAVQRSNGSWVCNTCWAPASEEHGGEECHRCRDWGSCRTNCTLTGISCRTCGVSQAA